MSNLPNVILIVLDTVRADRLSCYGHERPTTPTIDRLANKAVLYEAAITPACWTLPSHASLFTGLFPSEHGAQTTTMPPPPVPTMAELLREAGYHTIALCRNPWMEHAPELRRGFDLCPDISSPPRLSAPRRLLRKLRHTVGVQDTGARATTEMVIERVRAAQKPFFCFANYMDAHPPSRHLGPFAVPGMSRAAAFVGRLRHIVNTKRGTQWDSLLTDGPRMLALLNHLYDNDVHYLDHHLGKLFDFLDSDGLADETLLILTSDHGENLGEHNLLWHFFSLHDTLLRVPLIIRLPGGEAAGLRIGAQVQLTDIVPSLARRLGLTPAEAVCRSDRPHLFDFESLSRNTWPAYAEHVVPPIINKWAERSTRYDFAPLRRDLRAARTDAHKYIEGSDGSRQLYDLRGDPSEVTNLTGTDQAVEKELSQQLSEWVTELRVSATDADGDADAPAVSERLRELGYL